MAMVMATSFTVPKRGMTPMSPLLVSSTTSKRYSLPCKQGDHQVVKCSISMNSFPSVLPVFGSSEGGDAIGPPFFPGSIFGKQVAEILHSETGDAIGPPFFPGSIFGKQAAEIVHSETGGYVGDLSNFPIGFFGKQVAEIIHSEGGSDVGDLSNFPIGFFGKHE
ncbi:hypothetical protein LINPERHAP1_LOCUS40683 [Linum perenne]